MHLSMNSPNERNFGSVGVLVAVDILNNVDVYLQLCGL